jgi:hypothetical protein
MSPPDVRNGRGVLDQRAVDDPARRALEDRSTTRGRAAVDDERPLQRGRSADVNRATRGRINYDMWLLLRWNSRFELGRAEDHYRGFSWILDLYGHLGTTGLERLEEDVRVVETIVGDADDGFDQVLNANRVLPEEEVDRLVDLVDVAEQGHSLLIQVNDALDVFVKVRLLRRMRSYTSLRIGRLSRRLLERLAPLIRALSTARQERDEAWIKGVLNTSISVATVVVPKLGLLARGGLYLTQFAVNAAIGDRSDEILAAAEGVTGMNSALDELENTSRRRRTISRGADRVVSITGFAFDVRDVFAGHRNVARIEALMNEAVAALDRLVSQIDEAKRRLELIEQSLSLLEAELTAEHIDVGAARAQLDSMMGRTEYVP